MEHQPTGGEVNKVPESSLSKRPWSTRKIQGCCPEPSPNHIATSQASSDGKIYQIRQTSNLTIEVDVISLLDRRSTRHVSTGLTMLGTYPFPPILVDDNHLVVLKDNRQALHLLTLDNMNWSTHLISGPSYPPLVAEGTMSQRSSNLFIFYGRDFWTLHLKPLTTYAWNRHRSQPGQVPSPRKDATYLAYLDQVYLFGGSGGDEKLFNDTWKFDTRNGSWRKLVCSGFSPPARQRHGTAIVDEVLYVFGGLQDERTKEIGGLSALNLSELWWYDLRDLPYSPLGSRDPKMICHGQTIYVLPGVTRFQRHRDIREHLANNIDILDTGHTLLARVQSLRPRLVITCPAPPDIQCVGALKMSMEASALDSQDMTVPPTVAPRSSGDLCQLGLVSCTLETFSSLSLGKTVQPINGLGLSQASGLGTAYPPRVIEESHIESLYQGVVCWCYEWNRFTIDDT